MGALRLRRAPDGPNVDTDVGVPNTNASRLESLVNGGLTDINLAAGFPVDIAAAASSLTDRQGRMGMVSAGGHYVRVVHDGDKYVSRTIQLFRQQEDHELTAPLATPTAAPAAKFPRLIIPGYKALYDAGLRAQAKVAAHVSPGQVGETSTDLHAVFFGVDDDDTALGDDVGSAHISDSPLPGYRVGDWTTIEDAPTLAHAVVVASLTGAAGDTVADGQAVMRWVYEP